MTPPIFVVGADGEILAFSSATDAEQWVESVDVEDGEYAGAYDSEGRRLTLVVTRPSARRGSLFKFIRLVQLTPVVLKEDESDPQHAAELRALLVQALSRIQNSPASGTDLRELTAEAFRRFQR
jgi:hypothetical protein